MNLSIVQAKRLFEATSRSIFAMRPSAICIGAQKAGTTALYEYLKLHPGVLMPAVKELDFFNCDSRYECGIHAYLGNFPRRGLRSANKITIDVTPGYLGGAERAAPRIAAFRKSMRIIVLLRDPVTRAFSAWQMYRQFTLSNPGWFLDWIRQCNRARGSDYFRARSRGFGENFTADIEEEIEAMRSGIPIEMPILALGDYVRHLTHYFHCFDRKQMIVFWSEEFRSQTLQTLAKIESFLGLKPHQWPVDQLKPRFTGNYGNDLPSESAEKLLREYYGPRNEALFQLVGSVAPWS